MSAASASRQRKQVILLSAIVGIAALFAIHAFVWAPHRARIAAQEKKMLQLKGQIEKARKELKAVPGVREEIARVAAELAPIRREHVLQPAAGSSPILEVQSRLFELARTSGFQIDNVSERTVRAIPRRLDAKKPARPAKPPPGAPKPPEPEAPIPEAVQVFTAEIGGVARYDDVADVLRRIEAFSPYICLAGMIIQARPEAPELHRVTLQLEWPIAVSGGAMDVSSGNGEP